MPKHDNALGAIMRGVDGCDVAFGWAIGEAFVAPDFQVARFQRRLKLLGGGPILLAVADENVVWKCRRHENLHQ
jgi:hypothetical protein